MSTQAARTIEEWGNYGTEDGPGYHLDGFSWRLDPPTDEDFKVLSEEVPQYLAAVDTFRAEDCEPEWRGMDN